MSSARGSLHLPALALLSGAAVLVGAAWSWRAGIRRSPAYTQALQQTLQHEAAQGKLGAPIEPGWWISGRLSAEHARLRVPVSGPDGTAELLAVAHQHDGAWQLAALTLQTSGQPIDLLDTADEHDGPAAAALHEARALSGADRHAEALLALDAVARIEPRLAEGWRLRGRSLVALSLTGAEEALLRAAALDPKDHDSREQLGMFYFQQSRYAECVDAYSDALRLAPRDSRGWYNRAVCHRALGAIDEAHRGAATGCDLGAKAACNMLATLESD